MLDLIDKLIIYIACFALYVTGAEIGLSIPPVIVSLTISALNSYFDTEEKLCVKPRSTIGSGIIFYLFSFFQRFLMSKKLIKFGLVGLYIILCKLQPQFIMFLPLICYDIFATKERLFSLFAFIPIIINFKHYPLTISVMLFVLLMFSYILKFRTQNYSKIKLDFTKYIDNSEEIAILLKKSNLDLIEKQDYEVNVAMLNERNRIAMEIHDNVGHLLSRCLLQIGAIMAINKDNVLKESLSSVKDTLSHAMDSIRNSVHNLHDEAVDLYSQINNLVADFTFCTIRLDYELSENIDIKLKYCTIAIVKEALSNIIKHSDATDVNIVLREHPALYQLIIQDNGHVSSYNPENGIGLSNISDRVSTFNGILHINIENGFRIFISIPKTP